MGDRRQPPEDHLRANKIKVTLHVDGVTYTMISQYAKHVGLATPNHGALMLLIKAIRALRDEYQWAEDAYHLAMVTQIENDRERLTDDHN